MQWTPDLAVGAEEIDSQHQELFRMAEQLFDVSNTSRSPGFCEELLRFLSDYAKKHFADEEAYMESIRYPGLQEQQREHADFISRLVMLKDDFEQSGRSVNVILKTNQFVLGWLRDHIIRNDKKIGEYVRSL
jgi:hemerythrin-like metal-binding domain